MIGLPRPQLVTFKRHRFGRKCPLPLSQPSMFLAIMSLRSCEYIDDILADVQYKQKTDVTVLYKILKCIFMVFLYIKYTAAEK